MRVAQVENLGSMSIERVVVACRGGIGNRLFQYAAALAIAKETGAEVFVHENSDVGFSEFLDGGIPTAGRRDLRCLAVDAPDQSSFWQGVDWRVRSELLRLRRNSAKFRQVAPHDSRAISSPLRTSKLLGLEGFFQHPSWYEPALGEVIQSLGAAVDRMMRPILHDQFERLGAYTVVSFRRGDYLRLGWELSLDYYQRALEKLPQSDGPLVIVSDDKLVSKFSESWFTDRGFDVVPHIQFGERGRLRDLALLSRATQVVMANSTFCWWGTVLGDTHALKTGTNRYVVAPRDWLIVHADSARLVRPAWIAI